MFGQDLDISTMPGYWAMKFYLDRWGEQGFTNYIISGDGGSTPISYDPIETPKAITLFKNLHPEYFEQNAIPTTNTLTAGIPTWGIIALIGAGAYFIFMRK